MLSFINLLLTHCGGFKRSIQYLHLYLYHWYTVFGQLQGPKIIKSKLTAEWFGEENERVTERLQREKHLKGKLICYHHWPRYKYSLSFTLFLILWVLPEGRWDHWPAFLLHNSQYGTWRTYTSADLQRTELSSCSRHLHGECNVVKKKEVYRWGFWSLLAVT